MKKNVIFGLLVMILAFCFIGCGDDDGGGKDPYKLSWGVWNNATYSNVSSQFTSAGASLTPAGSDAGYLIGSSASTAYTTITNLYDFNDGGYKTGSFESLVEFKKDGIGAPQDLKTAILAQKDNVPVGGVYQASAGGINIVVLCFIEKN